LFGGVQRIRSKACAIKFQKLTGSLNARKMRGELASPICSLQNPRSL
jgi:hypothetical protein